MQRKHTREQLDQHQRAVDRIIFLAVKRRDCERELRDLASQASGEKAIWMPNELGVAQHGNWDHADLVERLKEEALVEASDIVAKEFVRGPVIGVRRG